MKMNNCDSYLSPYKKEIITEERKIIQKKNRWSLRREKSYHVYSKKNKHHLVCEVNRTNCVRPLLIKKFSHISVTTKMQKDRKKVCLTDTI